MLDIRLIREQTEFVKQAIIVVTTTRPRSMRYSPPMSAAVSCCVKSKH
jgi:hypothetical protein